jgi:hypothetical protein
MKRGQLTLTVVAIGACVAGGCGSSGGAAGSGGSGGTGGGTAAGAGGTGTGGTGTGGTGGANEPLAGSWESEYVTAGQRDSFQIGANLRGQGTYYSVVPGVACTVEIAAQRGTAPGSYVGLLTFGAPCSAVAPMQGFSCALADGATRLLCGDDRSYRRAGGAATGGTGGGGAGAGGAGGTTGGTGGGGTGAAGGSGGTGDPLVGSWESEYVTQGQRDTFEIRSDLGGRGTYYSVVPGTACAVDISAQHGQGPGKYVGTLQFGPPCNLVMPQGAFSCELVAAASRLVCGDDKSYRRR